MRHIIVAAVAVGMCWVAAAGCAQGHGNWIGRGHGVGRGHGRVPPGQVRSAQVHNRNAVRKASR